MAYKDPEQRKRWQRARRAVPVTIQVQPSELRRWRQAANDEPPGIVKLSLEEWMVWQLNWSADRWLSRDRSKDAERYADPNSYTHLNQPA